MVALSEVTVDIVVAEDEARFRDLMQAHHYLGAVPGMGETMRNLARNPRRVLDFLKMTANACQRAAPG